MRRLAVLFVLTAVIGAATLSGLSGAVFTDRKTNPQTLKSASTWPTPTPTAPPTPTPTPTPPPGTGLKARYRNNNPTVVSDNAITPWLQLVNGTTAPINIASAKLRYWFTKDTPGATVNTYCDYALLDCSKVTHVALPFSPWTESSAVRRPASRSAARPCNSSARPRPVPRTRGATASEST